jgi:hypothetical protein
MEKTFTYQFTTKEYYIASSDEYECDYDEYEYTACGEELKDAIVDELFYCYFRESERKLFNANQVCIIKKALKSFTKENGNWEELANDFESELKEHFRDDAYEEYKNRG